MRGAASQICEREAWSHTELAHRGQVCGDSDVETQKELLDFDRLGQLSGIQIRSKPRAKIRSKPRAQIRSKPRVHIRSKPRISNHSRTHNRYHQSNMHTSD